MDALSGTDTKIPENVGVTSPSSITIARYKQRLVKEKDKRAGISHLKSRIPISHYPYFLNTLSKFDYFKKIFAAAAFPKTLPEIRPGRICAILSLEKELAWTASVLKQFEFEIERFVTLERQFSEARLRAEYEHANKILQAIENEFGLSFWLIENKLGLLQEFGGIESQKEYRNSIEASPDAHFFAGYFARFYSRRAEPTHSAAKYRQNTKATLRRVKDARLRTYLSYYLLPISDIKSPEYAAVLGFDENSPVIDRYITFLKVCQHICAFSSKAENSAAPEIKHIKQALEVSKIAIDDYRLDNLSFVCQVPAAINKLIPENSGIEVFDHYTVGEYRLASQHVAQILNESPVRADLYEIYVRSIARDASMVAIKPPNTLIENTLKRMFDVLVRGAEFPESLEILTKLTQTIGCFSVATQLSAFLERQTSHIPHDQVTAKAILAALNCPTANPWQYPAFKVVNPTIKSPEDIFKAFSKSPSVQLQYIMENDSLSTEERVAKLSEIELTKDRRVYYTARLYERVKEVEKATALFEAWLKDAKAPLHLEAVSRLAWNFLSLNRYADCVSLIAKVFLENPNISVSLPIQEVLSAIEAKNSHADCDAFRLSIVYDAYSVNGVTDRDGPRADAYEDALILYGFSRPSELRTIVVSETDKTQRAVFQYYLRNICIPRIMDTSTAFEGTKDLLKERISVCQLLTEIDPANAQTYNDEIRGLTQQIVVGEGVRHVDQSKIYVDTLALKEALKKSLPESYKRYIDLATNRALDTDYSAVKVYKIVSDNVEALLLLPGNERDEILEFIVQEFRDNFVSNPVYGLATYLSGRVRHGVLPNHLRSPLEVAHLTTQKDSASNTYQRNEYWPSQFPWLEQNVRDALGIRLASFTEEVDELISMMNQRWIQVKRQTSPEGLFDFEPTTDDWKKLIDSINPETAYDEFVEVLLQLFWEITDRNLTIVRGKIEDELKPRINSAFDKLEGDILSILDISDVPKLQSSIATARTEIQNAVERVKSWFRLSKATDKPNFDLRTLVQIAVQSTNNCFRHSPLNPTVEITGNLEMPGNTLPAFVELLFIFLANVVKHSNFYDNVSDTQIIVSVTQPFKVRFEIENQVLFGSDEECALARRKIEKAQAMMNGADAAALVAREGGSGYAKAWKIVNHDLGFQNSLIFGLIDNDRFRVDLTLDTEKRVIQT